MFPSFILGFSLLWFPPRRIGCHSGSTSPLSNLSFPPQLVFSPRSLSSPQWFILSQCVSSPKRLESIPPKYLQVNLSSWECGPMFRMSRHHFKSESVACEKDCENKISKILNSEKIYVDRLMTPCRARFQVLSSVRSSSLYTWSDDKMYFYTRQVW